MGIRVHKAVGYGLRNFTPPKGFARRLAKLHNIKPDAFYAYTKANKAEIVELAASVWKPYPLTFQTDTPREVIEKTAKNIALGNLISLSPDFGEKVPMYRSVIFNPEGGIKGAILLTPPSCPEWHRYDDLIDWIEERQPTGGTSVVTNIPESEPRNRFEVINAALHPYNYRSPPSPVAALCHFLEVPDLMPQLTEALYVYWS